MNDEELLRDRLHGEVASVHLPPDLTGRVVVGARRRRHARLAVAGTALATVAAVAGTVALLPQRAPTTPAAATCALPAPAAGVDRGPAPAGTDVSGWGFRGDPALKELVRRYAGTRAGAVPLLAQRLDPPQPGKEVDFLWALAVPIEGSWWLQVGGASGTAAKPDGGNVFFEPPRPLPAPVPGALVSAVVHTELMNDPQEPETLLLLAPPGTGTVDYRPCDADGGTADVVARGDALLALRLGGRPFPQELRGQATVTGADGTTVHSGRVDDWSPEVRRQRLPGPVEKPTYVNGATYTGGQLWDARFTAPGQRMVLGRAAGGRSDVQDVTVTAACLGEGSLRVEVRGQAATVPCDGSRRSVYRGAYDLAGDDMEITSAGDGANLLAFVSIPSVLVSR